MNGCRVFKFVRSDDLGSLTRPASIEALAPIVEELSRRHRPVDKCDRVRRIRQDGRA
jgi:hypothetical protein